MTACTSSTERLTSTVTQKIARVEVFNVNGGPKITIPVSCYTATDCLRVMVAEATPGTATKRNAQHALSNIRLLPGESWPSAIDRLIQVFRAATVSADRPALSEEEYFWMAIGAEDLQALCNRAILLCCQVSDDISTFRSVLMQRTGQNNATLQNYPVDVHALGSPAIVERGAAARRCFYGFATILGQNSIYYWNSVGPPQPPHRDCGTPLPAEAAGITGVSKLTTIGGVPGHRETRRDASQGTQHRRDHRGADKGHYQTPPRQAGRPAPPSTATTDIVGGPRKFLRERHQRASGRLLSGTPEPQNTGPPGASAPPRTERRSQRRGSASHHNQRRTLRPLPLATGRSRGADIGVARGVQWWTPGMARMKTIEAGVQVATSYTTKCEDVERMRLLKEPVPPQVEPEPPPVLPRTSEPKPDTPDEGIRVSEINTGPLSHSAHATLLELVLAQAKKGLFPRNDTELSQLHGREVETPLTDENVTPIACMQQSFNPTDADIVNSQVDVMRENQIVDYSDSQWCSCIVIPYRKDGKPRLTIDCRPINAVAKGNSRGICTISTMHYRVWKSKWFTLLDLPQAYHQIPIKVSDRHKTAFRDARGRLSQFNRCSFGLTTIPAAFSALLGDTLRPAKNSGCIERCLDDILIHTETLEQHFKVPEEVLDLLQKAGYSGHFRKRMFCMPEPLTEMEKPTTVEELQSFIEMANFLRDFVKDFSALIAPITDILRNKGFSTKRARHNRIACGQPQEDARLAVISALVSPPVLLPPDWELPFTIHTDASERAAEAVLTQLGEHRDSAIGFGSHSQRLSSTMYRYVLRMMEFTMTLRWREGTEHTVPDALSRLPQKGLAGQPIDTSFPDDTSSPSDRIQEPLGPVLDGVPLQDLALAKDAEERGALLALGDTLRADAAIEPDWTTLECARANAWSHGVTLVRTPLASPRCREVIAEAKPEVIIGNARRRRTAAASALEEFTLPPMLREVVPTLEICGVVSTRADTWRSLADDILFRVHSAEQAEAPDSHGDDDDERLDTPELRRGLSANLERMENVVRDPTQLAEAQRRDPSLASIRAALEKDQGDGIADFLADNYLLWHAPRGRRHTVAVPRAVERTGGWLQETLSLLCRAWPRRWDDYVPVATWIHRVTTDPSLPGGASPYQILFGRAPRSSIDLLAQPLDGASFGQGLGTSVEEQHHMTQEILAKRQEDFTTGNGNATTPGSPASHQEPRPR
eukprot:g5648.t1